MRIELGYKFIIGFIIVIAVVVFTPYVITFLEPGDWLREPLYLLIAITVGLIIGTVLSKGLTRSFHQLSTLAYKMGIGDLTHNADLTGAKIFQDETNDLAYSLSQTFQNLRELVIHIKRASKDITNTSADLSRLLEKANETSLEVKKVMYGISKGASEQARYISKSSGIIEEMAEAAEGVSLKAEDMASKALETHQTVRSGTLTSGIALNKLEKVFEEMDRSKGMIMSLAEKTKSIPKILDVINHISRQTDLLAINATIEASKAGEQGEGFAMVAEEVRRFADNTSKSSDEVALIIKEVNTEMERVVSVFKEGSAFIREGRHDIHQIQESLVTILNYVEQVKDKAEEIVVLSQQQRKGAQETVVVSKEVSKIVDNHLLATEKVNKVIDLHMKPIEEVAGSFKRLIERAQELEWVVMKFKTEDEEDTSYETLASPKVEELP
ncbi:MAG: methyl-accepting chemotaxis protein [Thermodesulfobacteriota bacterium]